MVAWRLVGRWRLVGGGGTVRLQARLRAVLDESFLTKNRGLQNAPSKAGGHWRGSKKRLEIREASLAALEGASFLHKGFRIQKTLDEGGSLDFSSCLLMFGLVFDLFLL